MNLHCAQGNCYTETFLWKDATLISEIEQGKAAILPTLKSEGYLCIFIDFYFFALLFQPKP